MQGTVQAEDTVTLRVPCHVQVMLNRTAEELSRDLRLYSALMFFQLGKLSAGAAAELAGVPKVIFLVLFAASTTFQFHKSRQRNSGLRSDDVRHSVGLRYFASTLPGVHRAPASASIAVSHDPCSRTCPIRTGCWSVTVTRYCQSSRIRVCPDLIGVTGRDRSLARQSAGGRGARRYCTFPAIECSGSGSR